MKKTISLLMVFSMMLSFGACSGTKDAFADIKLSESQRTWSNPDGKYKAVIEEYADDSFTGTLAIATDKDIVYLYAEKETEKDGTTLESQDTVFDIASVSKTFTAVAILQLAEKGKLKLDDTIDKFFPEYNEDKLLTDYIAFNSFGVKEAGGTQKETSRGKIKLGGQDYLKAETVISIGDMHVCYYARKIDDDVILFMSISFPKNRTAEEFEKCFE